LRIDRLSLRRDGAFGWAGARPGQRVRAARRGESLGQHPLRRHWTQVGVRCVGRAI